LKALSVNKLSWLFCINFMFIAIILLMTFENVKKLYLVLFRNTELKKTSELPFGFFIDID